MAKQIVKVEIVVQKPSHFLGLDRKFAKVTFADGSTQVISEEGECIVVDEIKAVPPVPQPKTEGT